MEWNRQKGHYLLLEFTGIFFKSHGFFNGKLHFCPVESIFVEMLLTFHQEKKEKNEVLWFGLTWEETSWFVELSLNIESVWCYPAYLQFSISQMMHLVTQTRPQCIRRDRSMKILAEVISSKDPVHGKNDGINHQYFCVQEALCYC